MNYKCIIFDCDGTLVDSELLCNLGLEIKLREYNIDESAEDMVKRFRGGKLAEIISSLEQKHDVEFDEDFEGSYRKIVEDLFEKKLKPVDGVIKMLKNLSIPFCVASSGPIKKIKQALNVSGLAHFFKDNIFSSYVVGSWKPEPGLFLYAAEKMGFKPEECLIIEDSMKGVQAALAGEFDVYAYASQNNKKEFEGIATKVFLNMTELETMLDTIQS